jgi:hypothetical protein
MLENKHEYIKCDVRPLRIMPACSESVECRLSTTMF